MQCTACLISATSLSGLSVLGMADGLRPQASKGSELGGGSSAASASCRPISPVYAGAPIPLMAPLLFAPIRLMAPLLFALIPHITPLEFALIQLMTNLRYPGAEQESSSLLLEPTADAEFERITSLVEVDRDVRQQLKDLRSLIKQVMTL